MAVVAAIPRTSVGAQFTSALAAKDFARIAQLLDPKVYFRALTPNRTWRAVGAEQVIEGALRNWLDDATEIDALTDLDVHPLWTAGGSATGSMGATRAGHSCSSSWATSRSVADASSGSGSCSGFRPREPVLEDDEEAIEA
jgi:hypothetical protein